jgi:hypothetical protein
MKTILLEFKTILAGKKRIFITGGAGFIDSRVVSLYYYPNSVVDIAKKFL